MATSRRQVAGEIGLSPRGLLKFLEGARPHEATRGKLERWYEEFRQEAEADLTATEALLVLLAALPPDERAGAIREASEFFRELYARRGAPPVPGLP